MDQQIITLKEALQIFNQRDKANCFVPSTISVWTFSKTTKTGGQLRIYENVKYLPPANPDAVFIDTIENILDPVKAAKNPRHFENYTRNIELPNGEIRKINILFIKTINEYTVIY